MGLMRPVSEEQIQELRTRMNRAFDESNTGGESKAPRGQMWAPLVDVAETEHEIVVHAELPGMKKEDIDIQLTGDSLMLRGDRQLEASERGHHHHRIERQYGPWQRVFQIEVPIDVARVSAIYELGVLTVRLPKEESIKPRQIKIDCP